MKRLLKGYIDKQTERLGRNITLALLGYGTTTKAAIELLSEIDGVSVTLRHPGLYSIDPGHSVRLKSNPAALYEIDEDVIIPSPSVRREKFPIPRTSEYITDLDLLFNNTKKPIFSVSGSDGKSTVTALSSLLLFPHFPDIFTGGNLGTPLFSASVDSDAFLLELSSFSLRYSVPKHGRAVLTNITPNHLDWHNSLSEYEECKLRLVRSVDEPILNLCDPVSEKAARDIHTFALVSDHWDHNELIKRYKTEHTVTVQGGEIRLDGERVLDTDQARHKERHNIINLALAIAMSIGYIDKERILKVASSFEGLTERCEHFTLGGIDYISSSIDTTPARTATTLSGLGKRVHIILGGRGKGLSLEPLRAPLTQFAKKIAVYGDIRDEICAFLSSDSELCKIPRAKFERLGEAIDWICERVTHGETVILSPAATSYGEFTDYRQRGRFFKERILDGCPKI